MTEMLALQINMKTAYMGELIGSIHRELKCVYKLKIDSGRLYSFSGGHLLHLRSKSYTLNNFA